MGIRFACPNGHPLHVKAELAGKRGICPQCNVRFVIPAPEGVAGAPTNQPTSGGAMDSVAIATESGAIAPKESPSQAAPQTAQRPAEAQMWYVRPAKGGQFGPADDRLVQQWAAEGRVGPDAYVWRTGWPDWRRASEAPEYFPQLVQQAAAAPIGVPNEYNNSSGAGDSGTAPSDVSLASARYQRRKQRSARGQMLAAIVLIVLAVSLAIVLVWVVNQSSTAPQIDNAAAPGAPAMAPSNDGAER